MKTPEEIKKGLECCLPRDEEWCGICPYSNEGCYTARIDDTIDYIQQLERERDTLMAQVRIGGRPCDTCKYCEDDYPGMPCESCQIIREGDHFVYDKWEWIGVSPKGEAEK